MINGKTQIISKKSEKGKNEFTQGNHYLLCSRVSRYNFKRKDKKLGHN